jgi:hypothetical protein
MIINNINYKVIISYSLFFLFISTRNSFAYLDPGTGSIIIQTIVAIIASFFAFSKYLKDTIINFLNDILNFYRLKKKEKIYKTGFFSETNFIYEYLEPHILNKLKKKKIILISFEKINVEYLDNEFIFVFHSNIIRELVFLTLNLKILYSSTPNLNQTIFKKTKFTNCKYIYLQHSPVSLNLIYSNNAFDSFDAIQVLSTFQLKEMKEIKDRNNLKIKIFKSQYLFPQKLKTLKKNQIVNEEILIAPSWNSNFYSTNCHILLKESLDKNNISFKLRPHPMSFKKNEISLDELAKHNIPIDKTSFMNLYNYNFLITDWSGAFIEFALLFKRKAFLINTPMKIINKDYSKYKNQPIEILLRNTLGKTFTIDNIDNLVNHIRSIKKDINTEDEEVKKIVDENFYK